MTSKTHLVIGMASSITAVSLMRPITREMWYCAVIGGAVGAMLPDVDIRTGKRKKDAFLGMITAAFIAACVLFLDWVSGALIIRSIAMRQSDSLVEGVFLLGMIFIFMKRSSHRGFSHSLVACALLCLALSRIYMMVIPYFAIGFGSHLILDMFNKKAVHIMFPFGKGISLRWCAADKKANSFCFLAGLVWLLMITSIMAAGQI